MDRRFSRLAVPVGVVVLVGVLVGTGELAAEPSGSPASSGRPEATPSESVGPVAGPAKSLRWHREPFAEERAVLNGLEVANGRLVAVGGLNGEPAVWYSDDDGDSWNRADISARSQPRSGDDLWPLDTVVASGGTLVATATIQDIDPYESQLWVSSDLGETWTWARSPADQIATITPVAEGFVAIGYDILSYEERRRGFWESADGLSWRHLAEAVPADIDVLGYAERAGIGVWAIRNPDLEDPASNDPPRVWVTGGDGDGHEVVVEDVRGSIRSVGASPNGFVASGYIGPIWEDHRAAAWRSVDGLRWVRIELDAELGSVAGSSVANELGTVVFGGIELPAWAMEFTRSQRTWFSQGGTGAGSYQWNDAFIRSLRATDGAHFVGVGDTCDADGNCRPLVVRADAIPDPALLSGMRIQWGNVGFILPDGWFVHKPMHQEWGNSHPLLYLASQAMHEECVRESSVDGGYTEICHWPIDRLEPGGLFVEWRTGLRLAPLPSGEPLTLDGKPASRTGFEDNACAGYGVGADGGSIVSVDRAPDTRDTITFCTRGLTDVSAGQIELFLDSLRWFDETDG